MNVRDPEQETKVQPFALRGVAVTVRNQPQLSFTDASGPRSVTLGEHTVVGSAAAAGLVVNDPAVSRIHAEFDPREDGLWVRDLGSKNGTFVEDVCVTGARVPEGGRIRLGSTVFSVHYARDTVPVELWPGERFNGLLGRSMVMRALFARIAKLAPSASPVLIHGETGTGKELVARAIHDASPRRTQPFVVVDCAALPENLLESELFGHARGAYTGAGEAREGAIEAADGGTVFLDEIGELPLAMQPKLLRVLESRTIRRLGETQHRRVDVRFLAATHRDLRKMVNSGAFREDLYFRLAVLPVDVPPLRERQEDVELLVQHFLPAGGGGLAPDVLHTLTRRPWLGNVRELRNFVHRAVALGAQEALDLERADAAVHVPAAQEIVAADARVSAPSLLPEVSAARASSPTISYDQPFKDFREQWQDRLERDYVTHMLARFQRNVAAVAEFAGLHRTYIYRLIRRHNL